MKYRFLKATGIVAVFIVALAGCKKDVTSSLSDADTRIYITQFDSTASFNSYKTFSVDDSLTVLDNGVPSKVQNSVGIAFSNAVINYMQRAGYTLVKKSDNPDLGINLTYINTTSTGLIDYGTYWDAYGGYYDPYYWGYGGYGYYMPYGFGTYQVNSGALSIDMLDLKNAQSTGKINIVWNGLIRGESIADGNSADAQVKTLFDQSPYLSAK